MNLRTIIENYDSISLGEAASGKDMDKLVSFLRKAAMGKIKQQGMIAAGFNLRDAASNNETRVAQALGTRLGINMTEDDFEAALKELKMKSASDVVAKWLEANRNDKDRKLDKDKSLEGSDGKKRF